MTEHIPLNNIIISIVSSSGTDLQNTAVLTWTVSSCFYPILNYNVYKDNILIVQTSNLTYTVQNLNYGESYNFKFLLLAKVQNHPLMQLQEVYQVHQLHC